jgi:hypothetical protein
MLRDNSSLLNTNTFSRECKTHCLRQHSTADDHYNGDDDNVNNNVFLDCQAKEEGTTVLINVSDYIPNDTGSHSIMFESSAIPLS